MERFCDESFIVCMLEVTVQDQTRPFGSHVHIVPFRTLHPAVDPRPYQPPFSPSAYPVVRVHPCISHHLVVLPRRLGMRVYDGMEELVDNLAARFVADGIDLLDLDVCVLLGILLSLLVA
jgi:hypothetical protein